MCGIVGMITGSSNGFSWGEAGMFRDMLVIDTLRGFDSTGVFGVSNRGNMGLVKAAQNGATFVQTKEFKEFNDQLQQFGMFAVGHNRAATRGEVNDVNAHPFCVDDKIVLVQNGTYKGDHSHHKKTAVDSEAVAHVLAENDDVEKALQKINAAYALVWYNIHTKTLNIIRNDERPMYITYTETGGVVFASEPEIILMAAARNNVKLKEAPYLIKEGGLVTYVIDPEEQTYKDDYKEINYKFDYKQAPPFRQTHRHPYSGYYDVDWQSPSQHRQTIPEVGTKEHKFGIDSVEYSLHHYITLDKFNEGYRFTEKQVDTLVQAYNGNQAQRIVVQLEDYLPCNPHKNCSTFFVFGKKFAIDTNAPTALFYTMLRNTTEIDVINLVAEEFVDVSPITPVKQRLGLIGDQPAFMASVYCTNMVPITAQENAAQHAH